MNRGKEMSRTYYEAYDDRYRQVHEASLQWFSKEPSRIVSEVIEQYSVDLTARILEIGCGEGRDAGFLMEHGYDVLATDVSPEAVSFCRKIFPHFAEQFAVLDCVREGLSGQFDFIYAVAVIHMLVLDDDRNAFYRFIHSHLKDTGIALVCTMGDGTVERCSDITTAFDLQERTHEATGKTLEIAGTSCRMVSFETFDEELRRNGLAVVKQGITAVEPDFPQMMYAVVKRGEIHG